MRLLIVFLSLVATNCAQAVPALQVQPSTPAVSVPATHNPFEPRDGFYEGVGSAPIGNDPDRQHARDLAWMRASRMFAQNICSTVYLQNKTVSSRGLIVGGRSTEEGTVGNTFWVRISMKKSDAEKQVHCY